MIYLIEADDHERVAKPKAESNRLLTIRSSRVQVFALRDTIDHYKGVSEKELRAVRVIGHHREGRDPDKRL